MARNQTSAQKRFRQSEVRRMHNKAIKSECRTYVKQFVEAVHAKDSKLAQEKLVLLTSKLDSARSKGVLTRNSVSRKKSRMQKLYNVTFAQAAAN
ncbi:30S ribosomal protein S20 [Treponema sp.]|uniref:30S ribosomal protein S20 n=1 Tax=Treponema sp. TaxID=166 RepID=UPI0025D17693|nr:30S ribosomal protein S20 [Treponema sp.]MBR4322752.1 30S ribosomal protein S20 [Treponema sp.]